MIKAEYKILDDKTGEVFMHGVATPDEVRDYSDYLMCYYNNHPNED